jgi:alpha-N-acetylglucosamine transferase
MPTTHEGQYPPEIIVLVPTDVSTSDTKILDFFCNRIIRVEPIVTKVHSEDYNTAEAMDKALDGHWTTKLRIFQLESYDTILYIINSNSLVLKDVSHLLHSKINGNTTEKKKVGLLAAVPHKNRTSNEFNTGVMLLRPSSSIFNDMMCHNPNPEQCEMEDFLNSFFPVPSYSCLSSGYYTESEEYNDATIIGKISIVHFSSSPKPWETIIDTSKCERTMDQTPVESMWQKAYARSRQYHTVELQKRKKAGQSSNQLKSSPPPSTDQSMTSSSRTKSRDTKSHVLVHKRYTQLRKSGMSIKEAMEKARQEYGLDKEEDNDPAGSVGKMFGLN